jgi:hypothetical protein
MTLRDDMAADVTAVFLVTSEHAQTITRYVKGNPDDSESVIAVVDAIDLDGTGAVEGDGRSIHNRQGTRTRNNIRLELPASVAINYPDGMGANQDQFVINERVYHAKRQLASDEWMQTVLVVSPQVMAVRSQQPRG